MIQQIYIECSKDKTKPEKRFFKFFLLVKRDSLYQKNISNKVL